MPVKTRIQLIKSLSDKRVRAEHSLFVVEGRKMVGEAVASEADIEGVYILNGADWQVPMSVSGVCEYVSDKEMERMSHLKTHSDVLAVVRIPENSEGIMVDPSKLVLYLDGVQDPGNLGTIIRIADWFGVGHIVCSPDSADCYNPKVVQATMGALFRVQVSYLPAAEYLTAAVEAGAEVYGTFLEGEDIYDSELSCGGVVVMGSEGRGVSPVAAIYVTRKLFIPPYPRGRCGSESLNVAAATSVICAEFRRRSYVRAK